MEQYGHVEYYLTGNQFEYYSYFRVGGEANKLFLNVRLTAERHFSYVSLRHAEQSRPYGNRQHPPS